MSLTVLQGPPGSGKTAHAIELLQAAQDSGRRTFVTISSELPRSMMRQSQLARGRFGSRTGATWPIDALAGSRELPDLLGALEPGTLAVVEDAYGFSDATVQAWLAASARGVDVVLVAPSRQQLATIDGPGISIREFTNACERCATRPASRVVLRDTDGSTGVFCDACFSEMAEQALLRMRELLRDGGPHEGQEYLYQPIEIPPFSDWRVVRTDSPARARVMHDAIVKASVLSVSASPTFLDIGSTTGYFCDYFAARGFQSKGVDLTHKNIEVARLLDSFVRRPRRASGAFVVYEQSDAYTYLRDSQAERVDVSSSLAVFQWIILQRDVQAGIDCIQWLAAKTKQLMFLEMGYTEEELYRSKLPITIDREWVVRQLQDAGFSSIRCLDRGEHGLRRDIFVASKIDAVVGI